MNNILVVNIGLIHIAKMERLDVWNLRIFSIKKRESQCQ